MKTTTDDRMANPPHPGAFIRTEILEPLNLSVTEGAKALSVSRPTLSNLLNAQADLSGDMALRIEKAFGVRMDTLMRMQVSYDIARTRQRDTSIAVRRYRGHAASPTHETTHGRRRIETRLSAMNRLSRRMLTFAPEASSEGRRAAHRTPSVRSAVGSDYGQPGRSPVRVRDALPYGSSPI